MVLHRELYSTPFEAISVFYPKIAIKPYTWGKLENYFTTVGTEPCIQVGFQYGLYMELGGFTAFVYYRHSWCE